MVCSKSITNFEFPRIFDFQFFVALCWYSYPSLMPAISAILNVWLIFDSYFAWTCFGLSSIFPLQFREQEKVTGGQIWGIRWLRLQYCCFGTKIRAQATMCSQGRHHGTKLNFCSPTNPGVSDGLLREICA